MQRWEYPPDLVEAWRCYPVRIVSPSVSACCGKLALLVCSMSGGYVTANCSQCGKPGTLSEANFKALRLWVVCPRCGKPMEPGYVPPKQQNYGFRCEDCQLCMWLSDLLPRWQDDG